MPEGREIGEGKDEMGKRNDRLQTMLLPLLLTLLPIASLADLPKDLDPFLEKLFEFEECESYYSMSILFLPFFLPYPSHLL